MVPVRPVTPPPVTATAGPDEGAYCRRGPGINNPVELWDWNGRNVSLHAKLPVLGQLEVAGRGDRWAPKRLRQLGEVVELTAICLSGAALRQMGRQIACVKSLRISSGLGTDLSIYLICPHKHCMSSEHFGQLALAI